ncbi:MAG TPA: transglycosylase SLT domain-containing protein [Burkholderiaceae bacterium]
MFKQVWGGSLAVQWPRAEFPLAFQRAGVRALAAATVLALAGTTSIDQGFDDPSVVSSASGVFDARDHLRHTLVSPLGAPALETRALPRKPAATAVEQRDVARFIAERYQVAIDQTQQFVDYAYRIAREVRLDPLLILAVMSVESSFNPRAQSPAGAQGLMQVLTRVHLDKFEPFGGAAAAFDPLANIRVGAQILKDYMRRDGTVEGALKSYVGAALLPDDGGYGRKVLGERELIAQAAGRPASAN